MQPPYLLISDTHYHGWSQFATTTPEGQNSRLIRSIEETKRAIRVLRENGGRTIVHAGDMFHVRGQVAPSVMNQVVKLYTEFANEHKDNLVLIMAGNHDLEHRESTLLGNASTALGFANTDNIHVVTRQQGHVVNDGLIMIPYDHDLKRLRETLAHYASLRNANHLDVVIHAPVNGVIKGIPDHGLEAKEIADYGFYRVFCGHYHNHAELVPGRVWSIGALTHQTWGDVGTKAGFMLVWDNTVSWFSTHAPQFIEIDGDTDPMEIPLIVDGNYVKARCKTDKESDVTALREYLQECGAAGVVIHAERDHSVTSRTGATVSTGASLGASVSAFVKASGFAHEAALNALCAEILTEAEAV